MENIIEYILGVIFIIIGFLIERFPMLLSGYNSLSKKEREQINTPQLMRIIRIISINMGLIIIISTVLLQFLGYSDLITPWVFVVIIIGALLIVVQQYNHTKNISNRKKHKYATYISSIVILFVISICFYTAMPAPININNYKLLIKGSYGLTLPLEDITEVKILEQLPKSIIRTNGLSFWKFHKGNFRLEKIGNAKLFLHTGKGPYLIIYSKDRSPIILNRSSDKEFTNLYKTINQSIIL